MVFRLSHVSSIKGKKCIFFSFRPFLSLHWTAYLVVQSNLAIRNFLVILKLNSTPKVPYPYEVNGKLLNGNGSLIPICSLLNRSLLPSLTVLIFGLRKLFSRKSCDERMFLGQQCRIGNVDSGYISSAINTFTVVPTDQGSKQCEKD